MTEGKCLGDHELYVAEVLYVEREGKCVVVTVCRHCGRTDFHSSQVASPGSTSVLLKNQKE